MNANVAMDMGSANVRVSAKGRGMILQQSAAHAMRATTVLRGDEAYELVGRETNGMEISFPIRADSIADEAAYVDWIRYLMDTAQASGVVSKLRLLIARPASMQKSQIRRMAALTMEAGANACAFVRADICAALGAGVPIGKPGAQLVIDVGASMVSGVLISMNRVIAEEYIPFGMAQMDSAIQRMLRAKYFLSVGTLTAEAVKISLATAASGTQMSEQVAGINGESGFPKTVNVEVSDVEACIAPLIAQIAQLAESMVRDIGPELLVDLMGVGIVLTGGGASVYGLDKMIAQATGLPCKVANEAQLCVLKGLDKIMDDIDDYERLIEEHQTILEKRLSVLRR